MHYVSTGYAHYTVRSYIGRHSDLGTRRFCVSFSLLGQGTSIDRERALTHTRIYIYTHARAYTVHTHVLAQTSKHSHAHTRSRTYNRSQPKTIKLIFNICNYLYFITMKCHFILFLTNVIMCIITFHHVKVAFHSYVKVHT